MLRRTAQVACLAGVLLAPAMAALLDDFLQAADNGECIESTTYRMIRFYGVGQTEAIVLDALKALSLREAQQRSMGCVGDIASQAIAAGADPDKVLSATAAGL